MTKAQSIYALEINASTFKQLAQQYEIQKATVQVLEPTLTADAYSVLLNNRFELFKAAVDAYRKLDEFDSEIWKDADVNQFELAEIYNKLGEN